MAKAKAWAAVLYVILVDAEQIPVRPPLDDVQYDGKFPLRSVGIVLSGIPCCYRGKGGKLIRGSGSNFKVPLENYAETKCASNWIESGIESLKRRGLTVKVFWHAWKTMPPQGFTNLTGKLKPEAHIEEDFNYTRYQGYSQRYSKSSALRLVEDWMASPKGEHLDAVIVSRFDIYWKIPLAQVIPTEISNRTIYTNFVGWYGEISDIVLLIPTAQLHNMSLEYVNCCSESESGHNIFNHVQSKWGVKICCMVPGEWPSDAVNPLYIIPREEARLGKILAGVMKDRENKRWYNGTWDRKKGEVVNVTQPLCF